MANQVLAAHDKLHVLVHNAVSCQGDRGQRASQYVCLIRARIMGVLVS